jgi:hypothetical protein
VALAASPTLALAASKPAKADVVSVDARHHRIELVRPGDRKHVTFVVVVRGRIATGIGRGSHVSYVVHGSGRKAYADHLRALPGRAARITVRGTITHTAAGMAVRLRDGQILSLAAAKATAAAHAAGDVSLVLQGFNDGQGVDVSIATDASGRTTITITIVHGSRTAPLPGDRISVEGTISDTSDVQGSALVLGADGNLYPFRVAADTLATLSIDDPVLVLGHYGPDLSPIADYVRDDAPPPPDPFDAIGLVTETSDASFTITLDDGTTQTYPSVDPTTTLLNACVEVTGTGSGDATVVDGVVPADACAATPVTESITGTVVALDPDAGTLTLQPDSGGDPIVIASDPDTLAALTEGDCVTVVDEPDGSGGRTLVSATPC